MTKAAIPVASQATGRSAKRSTRTATAASLRTSDARGRSRPRTDSTNTAARRRFVLFVYRMPQKPTAGRVAVWRMLKKIGAIYIQQSVCAFPANSALERDLAAVVARISASGGEYHLLPLADQSDSEQTKLIAQFREQATRHYEEIIENCEVNFQKEIEFEIYRKNFTYEEAEEIRSDYDKIVSWFQRVQERDWFDAPARRDAEGWLVKCQQMLERFEARVYAAQTRSTDAKARTERARSRTARTRRGRRVAGP